MPIIPQFIDSVQSPPKFQWHIFTEIENKTPKICMESHRPWIAKEILREKKKPTGIRVLSSFKLYYKAIIIKTVWYWHKDTQTNGRESRIKPWIYGQLIFGKWAKNTQWGKNGLFNKWP